MNGPLTMQIRVERYLTHRRKAGFQLLIEGQQLERFACFADQGSHQGPLTLDLAVRWATASRGNRALTAARRIEVLRGFARFCQQFEPATDVPPLRLFGSGHRRLTPHIYTDNEIGQLLDATATLHPVGGLRGACCRVIFGLIAASGLRLSEAIGLDRSDVDLERGLLLIRRGKFGKSRWVPLHTSTTDALRHYAERRDRECGSARSSAFFIGDHGRTAQVTSVEYAFRLMRQRLKWHSRGDHPFPRIHDLRHTFVCRTLQRWYTEGIDIDRRILALSTYIGHAKVSDTYWYVTATPELMAVAAERFERTTAKE